MTEIADAIAQKLWPEFPLHHDACFHRKARGALGRIEEGGPRLCFLGLPRSEFGVPALAGPATRPTNHLQNRLKAGLQTTLPQDLSVQGHRIVFYAASHTDSIARDTER